jgi:hypothetical protein
MGFDPFRSTTINSSRFDAPLRLEVRISRPATQNPARITLGVFDTGVEDALADLDLSEHVGRVASMLIVVDLRATTNLAPLTHFLAQHLGIRYAELAAWIGTTFMAALRDVIAQEDRT